MTRVLFFVILFTGLYWPEAGDAFEPWEGKATTVLNVRKSPELDSQAIGWLDKGQRVTINDAKKLWYKIIFEIEGKRYRVGWVYRRYIQRISTEKMEISSALEKVRAGIAVEGLQEKVPFDGRADKGRLPNVVEKGSKKTSIPTTIHVVKEQKRMAPQERIPNNKKAARDAVPEKTNAAREQTRSVSRIKSAKKEKLSTSPAPATIPVMKEQTRAIAQTQPSVPKMEVSTTPPPAITPVISKRDDTPPRTRVPVVQEPLKQEPRVSHPEKGLTGTQELKELAKLALRLLSVVLSCLAILFSYKAIKLSKISYNTAMQLQRNLQVWQQREDGQLG